MSTYSAVVLAHCMNSCGYAAYWQQCRVNFVTAVVFCSRSTVGHSKQKCYVLTCSKSEYSQKRLVGSSVHNLVTQHLWQDM
jgi:hypothetical protein